jgi:hypothetical protein
MKGRGEALLRKSVTGASVAEKRRCMKIGLDYITATMAYGATIA